MVIDLARELVFFAVLIVSAWTDIARGHVYNWVTFPGIMLGFGLAVLSCLDTGQAGPVVSSLAGLAIGFAALGLFCWKGHVGAGDVKLMAAVGALQGYPAIMGILFYSALVGSILGIVTVLTRGEFWARLRGAGQALVLKSATAPVATEAGAAATPGGVTIPFGFAIAVGGMYTWVLTHL